MWVDGFRFHFSENKEHFLANKYLFCKAKYIVDQRTEGIINFWSVWKCLVKIDISSVCPTMDWGDEGDSTEHFWKHFSCDRIYNCIMYKDVRKDLSAAVIHHERKRTFLEKDSSIKYILTAGYLVCSLNCTAYFVMV